MFQKNILGVVFISAFVFASSAYAGKVELTTYYPAPYGEYTTLKVTPTSTDPTNGIDTFGIWTSGTFGGGIGLQDGTGNFGIWLDTTGTAARFGFGNSLGSLTTRVSILSTGDVTASSFAATAGPANAYKYSTTLVQTCPDYVFESGYKLMPLNELRDYVFTNKHLPGLPSSEEMRKAGTASLVEQDFKNLEKIEELALYILQLKAEAGTLETNNARLEARVKAIEEKLDSGE